MVSKKVINKKYENLWEDVYAHRRESVSKIRAIFSANAQVMVEEAKNYFKPEKDKIQEVWERRRNKELIIEEEKYYNSYPVDNVVLLLSTERKLLELPAEEKGMINKAGEYGKEVINKVLETYKIKISPYMYYAIQNND